MVVSAFSVVSIVKINLVRTDNGGYSDKIVDGNGSLRDIGSIHGLERWWSYLSWLQMHDLRSLALLEFRFYSHPTTEIEGVLGMLLNSKCHLDESEDEASAITEEENTHLTFIQIQADPESAIKITNLIRPIHSLKPWTWQSQHHRSLLQTNSSAPNHPSSIHEPRYNTVLDTMGIGMRWASFRDSLSDSVDFLSRESQEGIRALPSSRKLDPRPHNEVVLGEDANQYLPSAFSAVENNRSPALLYIEDSELIDHWGAVINAILAVAWRTVNPIDFLRHDFWSFRSCSQNISSTTWHRDLDFNNQISLLSSSRRIITKERNEKPGDGTRVVTLDMWSVLGSHDLFNELKKNSFKLIHPLVLVETSCAKMTISDVPRN